MPKPTSIDLSATQELRAARARSILFSRPGFVIRRLHQIHMGLFIAEVGAFNITPVQYSLLTTLVEHNEIEQTDLCMEIGLERTSVSEILPRLEARGLLSRKPSALDRRVKLVKITRKGRNLLRRIEPAARRAHDRTIEAIAPEERNHLLMQLVRLVEANNEFGNAPMRIRKNSG